MTKDKIIGAVIMILAILLIIVYTVIGPIDLFLASSPAGWDWLDTITAWMRDIPGMNYLWAMMLPLFLVVFLVGVIAAWIGFSMLTTPPPVPLEELEEELEAEEAEEDKGSD
jgi:hypothetical protein